jgi:hypothetical protein
MEEGVDEENEEEEAEPVEENNARNPDAEFNINEADVDSDDSDFAPDAYNDLEVEIGDDQVFEFHGGKFFINIIFIYACFNH